MLTTIATGSGLIRNASEKKANLINIYFWVFGNRKEQNDRIKDVLENSNGLQKSNSNIKSAANRRIDKIELNLTLLMKVIEIIIIDIRTKNK
jgi:hypothetical protein